MDMYDWYDEDQEKGGYDDPDDEGFKEPAEWDQEGFGVVLCGANAYTEQYYLNPEFLALPEKVRQELQIMCVLLNAEIGGIVLLYFDEDGSLAFRVSAAENDLLFDEIGSALKIKQVREQKRQLLESLEMYYKVFFLDTRE
jgi:hypothetical protein